MNQLAQRRVERLLAHIERCQELPDVDAGMATDEIEDAMMHAAEAVLCENFRAGRSMTRRYAKWSRVIASFPRAISFWSTILTFPSTIHTIGQES